MEGLSGGRQDLTYLPLSTAPPSPPMGRISSQRGRGRNRETCADVIVVARGEIMLIWIRSVRWKEIRF